MNNLEVYWQSPKTSRVEMVFARELSLDQLQRLYYMIHNHGDWPELKNLIETHEGGEIAYLVSGEASSKNTIKLKLSVQLK